ncbi:hypothetical protein BESB_024950 [Besnoitia besnoiti]|uniref:RIIa domain-containing protein n=1 Tax=Besnoitia besnoiti TaxID=94643 RepID=A0A2A9M0Q0_BESBE|nr:uncharacterized protein BESB_024950 [Besnoitia besnoiti]PFH31529.1 hypothetical protein BESB_024950 [Besnoitia besnoiti]
MEPSTHADCAPLSGERAPSAFWPSLAGCPGDVFSLAASAFPRDDARRRALEGEKDADSRAQTHGKARAGGDRHEAPGAELQAEEQGEGLSARDTSGEKEERRSTGGTGPPRMTTAAKRLLVDDETLDSILNDTEKLENLKKRGEELQNEHWAYVTAHEELRAVMNDFAAAVLISMPDDIYAFARDYFSAFA